MIEWGLLERINGSPMIGTSARAKLLFFSSEQMVISLSIELGAYMLFSYHGFSLIIISAAILAMHDDNGVFPLQKETKA